jgi:hypothetical protein
MKHFADHWVDLIIEEESPRLDAIMRDIAGHIQEDVIAVTYSVIDDFYADYTKEDGRKYIRTDEVKHPRGKGNRFRAKTKSEWGSRRSKDVSLRSAIQRMENGEPAIGVCRPLDGVFGYQAGVIFDEEKLASQMKHSVKGENFTEWDIVQNFLWGVHGNEDVYTTIPSASVVLNDYINNYKSQFDKHYRNACKKH